MTVNWKNTAYITKMGIEGTVALASLAGTITAILIATKVIAGPASLALIASPARIAVLFIAAVYFAALAYSSYQQMHANEKAGVNGKDGAPGTTLSDDDLKEKVKTFLLDPNVVTDEVKSLFAA